jgi:hypothetical protein
VTKQFLDLRVLSCKGKENDVLIRYNISNKTEASEIISIGRMDLGYCYRVEKEEICICTERIKD